MSTAHAIAAVCFGAFVLVHSQSAGAGEVGTAIQKCDLSAANSTCQWQPKTCPPLPAAPTPGAASNMSAYNAAVSQYNDYVRTAEAYMQCITKEGSADIHAFPAVVQKTVDAQQRAIQANLETAKHSLESARHGLPAATSGINPPGHQPAH